LIFGVLAPLSTIFQFSISWRPVLVVEEAGVPGENPDHGQTTGKLYHLRLRVECDKQLVNSITCGCESSADHGQATGKLYHLRLRVECPFFVIYKAGTNRGCESSAPFFVIYKAGREPTPYWNHRPWASNW